MTNPIHALHVDDPHVQHALDCAVSAACGALDEAFPGLVAAAGAGGAMAGLADALRAHLAAMVCGKGGEAAACARELPALAATDESFGLGTPPAEAGSAGEPCEWLAIDFQSRRVLDRAGGGFVGFTSFAGAASDARLLKATRSAALGDRTQAVQALLEVFARMGISPAACRVRLVPARWCGQTEAFEVGAAFTAEGLR